MNKKKSYLEKKVLCFLGVLVILQLILMSCMMLLGGGVAIKLIPAAELAFVEEYKLVAEKARVNWADMLIYDTVRFENDFDLADPHETVFQFLVIDYQRLEKHYFCRDKDERGNCIEEDYEWVVVESKLLNGKSEIIGKLQELGFSCNTIFEVVDRFSELDKSPEFSIMLESRDLEDMMVYLTEDEIEWVNLLVSTNFIFEMFGGYFQLPDHIPVAEDVKFAWPTPTLHTITSPFGWRIHPVTKQYEFHYGIDIAGPNAMGQPIISVADGVVFQVNFTNTTAGYNVRITHFDKEGNQWESRYCHMSQINVRVGQQVNQGDVIGAVGNTGRSTGPHLHFELRFGGQLIDPYPYISNNY